MTDYFCMLKKFLKYIQRFLQNFKCDSSDNKGTENRKTNLANIKSQVKPNELNCHNGTELPYQVKSTSNLKDETSIKRNGYVRPVLGSFECKIDSRSWKSCRFCRFNRCITSGMRPGSQVTNTVWICIPYNVSTILYWVLFWFRLGVNTGRKKPSSYQTNKKQKD